MLTDVQETYLEDLKDKKRVMSGRGIRSRKMMLPSEMMTRSARLYYKLCGEVVTYNMYDTMMSKEDFLALAPEQQAVAMQHWREKFGTTAVKKQMGWNGASLYRLIEQLGLPKMPRTKSKIESVPVKTKRSAVPQVVAAQAEPVTNVVEVISKDSLIELFTAFRDAQAEIKSQGMALAVTGQYDGKTVANKIMKFASLIEDESMMFDIEISIRERA